MRYKIDFRLSQESFSIELDHKQSTGFDFKIAKIIANDLLQVYLHDELNLLDLNAGKEKSQVIPKFKLTWLYSKTALIELIYALHSLKVFGANVGIKEIVAIFESIFNISLGDFYRTFLEIRIRKTGRTKFIDTLKMSLEKRMEDQDEN